MKSRSRQQTINLQMHPIGSLCTTVDYYIGTAPRYQRLFHFNRVTTIKVCLSVRIQHRKWPVNIVQYKDFLLLPFNAGSFLKGKRFFMYTILFLQITFTIQLLTVDPYILTCPPRATCLFQRVQVIHKSIKLIHSMGIFSDMRLF